MYLNQSTNQHSLKPFTEGNLIVAMAPIHSGSVADTTCLQKKVHAGTRLQCGFRSTKCMDLKSGHEYPLQCLHLMRLHQCVAQLRVRLQTACSYQRFVEASVHRRAFPIHCQTGEAHASTYVTCIYTYATCAEKDF